MNKTDVIFLLVIIIAILFLYKKQENFTSTESNEAVQNIASVYAETSGTVSFNNLNVTGNFNMIPRGTVVAWYDASTNNAPDGWHICDGTQGTPDLRGRFILGYNLPAYPAGGLAQRPVGGGGGNENVQLTNDEIPSHTHSYLKVNTWHDGGGISGGTCCIASGNGAQNVTATTDGGTVGNGPSTPNTPHNNMPPFLVLKYIMKM